MKIRLATNADQHGIVDLIDGVFQEYNDAVCLDDSESDLLDIQSNFFMAGGGFWVLVDDPPTETILGTHAALPVPDKNGVCTFKRLYLAQNLRGTEWGYRLMQTTIDWAIESKMHRIEFWSDTRFERAHRFFEKFKFQKSGQVRTMHDSHVAYQEYFYFLDLNV